MYTINGLFSDLIKGVKEGSRRLKTEIGTTSFTEGRDFRSFKEFSLSDGESYTIKITTPVNVDINELIINLESGGVRYESLSNPDTESGFSETLIAFPMNGRSDKVGNYTPEVSLLGGGTITGGLVVDLGLFRTGTNNQRESIIDGDREARGLSAGTYYIRITATNNSTTGIINALWSEG